jgi:hypothetical protein
MTACKVHDRDDASILGRLDAAPDAVGRVLERLATPASDEHERKQRRALHGSAATRTL